MDSKFIDGKTFFITGGTGTLGKALVLKIKSCGGKVVVFSRDEGKQALLYGHDSSIIRIIGDIRDYDKLNVSIKRSKPDIIIHTAALKRIDDMEFYPDECVKTNIEGSENVAKAAFENKVKKCILISTDKACQPVNVYGSSKFIAERVFTNYDYFSEHTIFSSVRYGNVLCSRGSFIPLWLSLLNDNKKINVTSLEMTRFLFTINDAVDTVLGAVKHSEGGEVFIPQIPSYDMRTIINAIKVIHAAEVQYNEVGLRPGEKLHEDMLALTELPFTYKVDNINLLCVRPQYTNRLHNKKWKKYTGTHFNSALHVSDDTKSLVDLIIRGSKENESQ
tara:strand:- start:3349 stop:4347 length:999 start_codon:yes stop_codon:yes gene_type:complete